MSTIAIDFNCTATAFTGSAAILAILLRGTAARGILASLFVVGHEFLLKNEPVFWAKDPFGELD